MKCPFCNKKLNKYDSKHIYYCNKKNIKDKKDIRYQYIKINYPLISNKNILYNDYIINKKSLPDLRLEYNISYYNIIFLLDYFSIKKRNKKESSKLISVDKYKKTCLLKYKVDNISKLNNNKKTKKYKHDKIIKILNDNYVNYKWLQNNFMFNDIYNIYKLTNKDFIKSEYIKIINNYYNYWLLLNDDEKNNLLSIDKEIEKKVYSILNKLQISYIINYKIGKNIYDIKIINTNILLEINDNYWHLNPKYYKKYDKIKFPFKNVHPLTIWNLDNHKKNIALKKGYKLIIIWENDITIDKIISIFN